MNLQRIYLLLLILFGQNLFSNNLPIHFILGEHKGLIYSVAFSPDGKFLASSGIDNKTKIWDFLTKKEIKTLRGHNHFVHTVRFSSDGKFLATGGDENSIKVWELSTYREIYRIPGYSNHFNCSVSFSPNGKYIATIDIGKTKNIQLWDVLTGKKIKSINVIGVPPLEISPNGNFIAVSTSNGDVKIYDHSSGKVSTLPKNQLPIRALSFHPSSRILIAASKDGFIKIWDILTVREIKLIDVKIPIQTVSVSPNGKWFAVGMMKGLVILWNFKDYKEIFKLQTDGDIITSVTFSPDNQYLVASGENKIHVWDLSNVKIE